MFAMSSIDEVPTFMTGKRGKAIILFRSFKYAENRSLMCGEIKWRCCARSCPAWVKTWGRSTNIVDSNYNHNHEAQTEKQLLTQRIRANAKRKAADEPDERPKNVFCSLNDEDVASNLLVNDDNLRKMLPVRHKTAKDETSTPTDGEEVTSSDVVNVKEECIETDPGAEITEDPVDESLPAAEPSPADDAEIRMLNSSKFRQFRLQAGNSTVRNAVNAAVKSNVPRKTKLDTMQAIYKAMKKVDDEEEEEDDGDCSESEDGALSDNHRDELVGHFLVGDSFFGDVEPVDEPPTKQGKFDKASWSDTPVSTENPKSSSWFSVTRYPGFIGDPSSYTTEVSFFSLFFDDNLIDYLVTHTNEEIRQKSTDDQGPIGLTNAIEIRAVLGLLLMNGLLRKTPVYPADLFSDCYGPPLFKSTISRNKLEIILRAMRFDVKETRKERKRADNFAEFRDFWTMFCDNCSKWYSPSEYLTVGESLLGFKGKCPFNFPSNQKLRYAMKLISLCDARTFYFCGGIPYLGKDFLEHDDLRLPTQYVVELSEQIQGSDRNITMDEWFTSVELADELKKRSLTMVGAIKKTEEEIPPELRSPKPFSEPKFAYQSDKMLVAFNLNNKNSIFLSTLHKNGVVNPQNGRPEVHELYEMTRVGLDIIDKNCEAYSSRRTSGRWSMRFFYRTLDLAAHNSYILYQLATNTTCRRADFVKRLALTLAEPLMQQRMYNTRLPKIMRQNVCQVLGVEPRKLVMEMAAASSNPTASSNPAASSNPQSAFSGRRRCWFCDSKKNRKTKKHCTHCHLPICGQHTVTISQCQLCAGASNGGGIVE